MKTKIIVLSVAVAIGFTVFGVTNKDRQNTGDPVKKAVSKALASSCQTISRPPVTEIGFWFHGNYVHPVRISQLKNANGLSDLIDAYPSSLISEHLSVKISYETDQVNLVATDSDVLLSPEQKELLSRLNLNDDFHVNVRFTSKDALSGELKQSEMHYKLTVIPEFQASFPNGTKGLMTYLRDECKGKATKESLDMFVESFFTFTIDENGRAKDIKIDQTLGTEYLNNLIVRTLTNMPKWTPAVDVYGNAIKQSFVLHINGLDGC